ncbi:MAG: molybdenum cofactor guanylyltransferase [Chloroflexi bacterium]|nr:molybdenum cofactor guanylyltransferase [Chloroflexota bacterium]
MASVTIAVLCGGQARRMGFDKGLAALHGTPMIQHVLDRILPLGYPVLLVSNDTTAYGVFGVPVVGDVLSQRGSLVGVHSALTHSQTPHTLCLACDMPLVNPALLGYLVGLTNTAELVIPRVGGYLEPLHAVYSRRCLPVIESMIKRGSMRIGALAEQVASRVVHEDELRQYDPELRSFANANTPAELDAIAQELARGPQQ